MMKKAEELVRKRAEAWARQRDMLASTAFELGMVNNKSTGFPWAQILYDKQGSCEIMFAWMLGAGNFKYKVTVFRCTGPYLEPFTECLVLMEWTGTVAGPHGTCVDRGRFVEGTTYHYVVVFDPEPYESQELHLTVTFPLQQESIDELVKARSAPIVESPADVFRRRERERQELLQAVEDAEQCAVATLAEQKMSDAQRAEEMHRLRVKFAQRRAEMGL